MTTGVQSDAALAAALFAALEAEALELELEGGSSEPEQGENGDSGGGAGL